MAAIPGAPTDAPRPFLRRPRSPAVSPDGDWIAWLLTDEHPQADTAGVWLRRIGSTDPDRLLGHLAVTVLCWSPVGPRLLVGAWDPAPGEGSLWAVAAGSEPQLLSTVPGVVEQIATASDDRIGLLVADPSADRGVVGGSRRYRPDASDPDISDADTGGRRILLLDGTNAAEIDLPAGARTAWELALLADGGLAALTSTDCSESGWYHTLIHVRGAATEAWTRGYVSDWQLAGLTADPTGRRLAFIEGWASDRGHLAGDGRVLDVETGEITMLPRPGFDVVTLAWRSHDSVWLSGWRGMSSCIGWVGTNRTDDSRGMSDRVGPVEEFADPLLEVRVAGSNIGAADTPRLPPFAAIRQRPGFAPELVVTGAGGWPDTGTPTDAGVPVEVEGTSWVASDGNAVEGLVVSAPRTEGSGRGLVVQIHGGPANLWHRGLGYGTLVLAAAGYRVLLANPRGSVGRGQDFARANLGDPGGRELTDLIAGVDHLVGSGLADPARVAFVGGSYGGYLTACAAAMTGRAAAAAMISGHPDLLSARHGSNNGAFYDRLLGTRPYGVHAAQLYLRRSPIVHVTDRTAPTLVLHGSADRCTPVGQAEEFHRALLDAGVPSELVIYPREGHGITEPDHQVDLWARVCSWFGRYLPS